MENKKYGLFAMGLFWDWLSGQGLPPSQRGPVKDE